jgi:anti-sigma-K factor RskA
MSKIMRVKRDGSMAQVVEQWHSKLEALSSNPSIVPPSQNKEKNSNQEIFMDTLRRERQCE